MEIQRGITAFAEVWYGWWEVKRT